MGWQWPGYVIDHARGGMIGLKTQISNLWGLDFPELGRKISLLCNGRDLGSGHLGGGESGVCCE